MKITYKNYNLYAGDGGVMPPNLYDLYIVRDVEEMKKGIKTGKVNNKEVLMGYGFTLTRALEQVIASEANKSADKLSLKDYLKACKQERVLLDKHLKY